MDTPALRLSKPVLPLVGSIFTALLLLFLAIPVEVLDQDETIYALIATELLNGHLPYSKVFDHKPIGIYYFYAFGQTLFGESFYSIRLMSILMVAIAAFFVSKALKDLELNSSSIVAALAGLLCTLLGMIGFSGNTEVFLTAIACVIFWNYIRLLTKFSNVHFLHCFTIGGLVAVGFSVNYLFSFFGLFSYLAFIASSLLLKKHSIVYLLKSSAFIFFGFLILNLLVYLPFILDALKGGSQFQNYLKEQQTFLSLYGNPIIKRVILEKLYIWFVPFLYIIFSAFYSIKSQQKNIQITAFFFIGFFVATLVSASVSKTFFNHYWALSSTAIAIGSAIAFEHIKDRFQLFSLSSAYAVALCLVLTLGSEKVINHHLNSGEAKDTHRAFNFIRSQISSKEPVANINASSVYSYVGNLNVNQKYLFSDHVSLLEKGGHLSSDNYFYTLLENNPSFVLTTPSHCSTQNENIETCKRLIQNYDLVASFEGYWPVEFYRLRQPIVFSD